MLKRSHKIKQDLIFIGSFFLNKFSGENSVEKAKGQFQRKVPMHTNSFTPYEVNAEWFKNRCYASSL